MCSRSNTGLFLYGLLRPGRRRAEKLQRKLQRLGGGSSIGTPTEVAFGASPLRLLRSHLPRKQGRSELHIADRPATRLTSRGLDREIAVRFLIPIKPFEEVEGLVARAFAFHPVEAGVGDVTARGEDFGDKCAAMGGL